jgi:magnesium transporter
MIRVLSETKTFKWVDVANPSAEELHQLAAEFDIHDAFVADVLQPEHLPKYEALGETAFFIFRYYSATGGSEEDTIQELTNKIAVFLTHHVVITIHRFDTGLIDDLKTTLIDNGRCKGPYHLLNRLTRAVFLTYESPAHALARQLDEFESETFLSKNPPRILKGLYLVKRQVEVSRRLLILSRDILEQIDDPAHQDPNTRDTRDLYVRLHTLFDAMSENANHLLTLYFSISAQKTNEIVRVLTIFSVFFMPLTFIVGIYGMNFDFMPELHTKAGYPIVMIAMLVITGGIFTWFKRKQWL